MVREQLSLLIRVEKRLSPYSDRAGDMRSALDSIWVQDSRWFLWFKKRED